ncbi:restriction endonuclease subunit S [uncultured Brachyspira sp.]|uniref:restriction endonuclease subunit S n=1 Tax=uncultured Brachyspira sp. TaxID=221953 RepID=UPI00262A94CD|nr:restriction endonuclease subunit S [uncultured Brachyspira sp.]
MSTKKSVWQECILKDIITIKKGKKPKNLYSEYKFGLMPYIDIKCFEKNIIDNYGDSDKMVIYDSNENHILLVWDGARSGLVGKFKGVGIVCSTIALIITSINKNFLEYYLNSKYTFLNKNTKGTGIPHINPDKLLNLKILIPPLEEQKLISEKIKSEFQKIDNALNKLNTIKEQIKQYKQSVLKYAFDENNSFAKGSNYKPYEWEEKILKDISESIQYGYTASASKVKNGIKFLRITDIQDGKVNWYNVPYCNISNNNKNKYLLKDGDLVFARTGATVGKSYLINNLEEESIFASYLIRIRFDNMTNFYYMKYYFQSNYYWEQINNNKVGIGQPNVNGTKLSKVKIKLPNIELQKTIADNIQNIFDKSDNIENIINENIDKLSVLKKSVLKKAFEGKLI